MRIPGNDNFFKARDFDEDIWGHQGPLLFTRTLKEYCENYTATNVIASKCAQLNILPHWWGHPLRITHWRFLFDIQMNDFVGWATNGRPETFAVHYWNNAAIKHTRKYRLRYVEEMPLYKLFLEHCPMTEEKMFRPLLGQEYQ